MILPEGVDESTAQLMDRDELVRRLATCYDLLTADYLASLLRREIVAPGQIN